MHPFRHRPILSAMLLLSLGSASTALPAAAQGTGTVPPTATRNQYLSLEETRRCVCLDAEITRIQGGGASQDPLAAEYKRLDALVEQARPNIDPYDQAEVDSFRRLYERREALRKQLNAQGGVLGPLIRQYNEQCAYRKMFKVNVDAVRANPQCSSQ